MKRVLFFSLIFISILFFGTVRPYPDGPFKVLLNVDGQAIRTNNSIELSSSTVVNEHFAGGFYTKSAGLTSFYLSKITTSNTNQLLDSWYNQGRNQPKNVYVRIMDGSNELLEGWKVFSIYINQRIVNNDGSVTYGFRDSDLIERDLEVPFPG